MSTDLTKKNLTDALTAFFQKMGCDVHIVDYTNAASEKAEQATEKNEDTPKTSELLEQLSAKFSQLSAEIDAKVTEWHKEINDLKDQVYQFWNIAKQNEKIAEQKVTRSTEPKKTEQKKTDAEAAGDLLNMVLSFFK